MFPTRLGIPSQLANGNIARRMHSTYQQVPAILGSDKHDLRGSVLGPVPPHKAAISHRHMDHETPLRYSYGFRPSLRKPTRSSAALCSILLSGDYSGRTGIIQPSDAYHSQSTLHLEAPVQFTRGIHD